MSKEYRDGLVKQLATMAEDTRIHIRLHRQEARKKIPRTLASSESKRIEREVKHSYYYHAHLCSFID